MRMLLVLATALIGVLVTTAVVLYGIDKETAYHSPLRVLETPETPHDQALLDLQQWRRRKAEAAARRAELLAHLDTQKMVTLGSEIFHGKGLCMNCHSVGTEPGGTQGPNLAGVGERAATRVPGLSDVDYLTQSLYHPNAFIVLGFSPAMPEIDKPPVALDDLEILMVIAYLQSLGGTLTVGPDTVLSRKIIEASGG